MSYYQPPMGPYPPTPYMGSGLGMGVGMGMGMGAPLGAYPPASYPYAAYQPYGGMGGMGAMGGAYGGLQGRYSGAYAGNYPYSLHPSYPQPYPPTYYQQQQVQPGLAAHPSQPQPQPQTQPQFAQPAFPASSVYAPPGTPGGMSAPAPAALSVSSTALQVDAQGLPIVPGDPALQVAQTFRVDERVSVTRDSFTVRDQQGALAYKVEGQLSLHERKVMKDAHGQALLKLREARLKMRDQITIFNTANVALLTLQKTAAIQVRSKRVHGYLGGHPSGTPVIIITGNHNNTHFRVANAQNEEIADIRRKKYTMKNMLTDQDTYEVTIQKGSPALVCFITVALDEIYED